jgi:hypothetical protein
MLLKIAIQRPTKTQPEPIKSEKRAKSCLQFSQIVVTFLTDYLCALFMCIAFGMSRFETLNLVTKFLAY